MDDIELAEIFEKEWGEKAITEPQEKIDDAQLDKLVKFVDWAVKRGGGALNDAKTKKEEELTEEEREMRKPFWARTYFIGASKREFRLDRDFINAYMQRASHMVKDNESAYHDYKRGRLFPRITDSSQAHKRVVIHSNRHHHIKTKTNHQTKSGSGRPAITSEETNTTQPDESEEQLGFVEYQEN